MPLFFRCVNFLFLTMTFVDKFITLNNEKYFICLGIPTFGKNAVVCGRSKNVGMPIAMLLHADNAGI